MSRQRRPGHYPAELRERAVRLVREGEAAYGSEWEAICAVAEMLGPKRCASGSAVPRSMPASDRD
jgi:transposase-like protein